MALVALAYYLLVVLVLHDCYLFTSTNTNPRDYFDIPLREQWQIPQVNECCSPIACTFILDSLHREFLLSESSKWPTVRLFYE